MDSNELVLVQAALEIAHRVPHEMGFYSKVRANIVPLPFHPPQFRHFQEEKASARFD
jgi:hypothetical protein